MKYFYGVAALVLFSTSVNAEWRVLTDNSKNNFIESVGNGAAVRVVCSAEFTILAVWMGQGFTAITPTIDGNTLEIASEKPTAKLWLYFLSDTGLQQLINGVALELKGTKSQSDATYGAVSLIGFTEAFNSAGMSCGRRP